MMALEYDNQIGGVGTEPFVELAQWKILGVKGTAQGHTIAKTGHKISELEIDVVVQRRYRYYIWKVFLPLLALVAIAYSAFWIKISDYYTQISITLTAILTEIAFLFAISSSLPKVPYLTFIDAFFLVSLRSAARALSSWSRSIRVTNGAAWNTRSESAQSREHCTRLFMSRVWF